jgi:pimeloyl-ACP methyl ester carboxylesterase
MKNIFLFLLAFLILVLVFLGFSYHPGIPVQELKEKYTYPESAFFEYEGIDVHYRVTGEGMPIVLLHGVSSSLHTWEVWQNILSDYFKVISIDVPSFGLSGPHPNANYEVEMYMGLLDNLLNHIGVDSCYFAGNSFGGYLTWNYALHQPQKVKKIILLDAAGFSRKEEDIDNIGFRMALNPYTSKITEIITPKFVVKKSVENVYGDISKIQDGTIDRYYDLLLREGNRAGFAKILRKLTSVPDLSEKISNVKQPTLIMWGDKDNLIPLDNAFKFEELIENSELIIYEGVGHIPMEEIPFESVKDVIKFLDK